MWQIKYVSAENFMSFEKVEYAFENKCYVVRGENLDNDGQQSNGGGKTSFADIAAIALFGYSLTGRNVKNCVNWNTDAKSFMVQVFLENEAYGMNCYVTRRVFSGSKGQELVLLLNGIVPETIPSKKGVENGVDVKEGNAYILREILDISENDLLNYYFISKKHYKPFLDVSTDLKLEVIGRFSRADVIDKVIINLEENIAQAELDVNNCNHEISKSAGHIEALNLMLLDDARQQFEADKEQQLSHIVGAINESAARCEAFDLEIERETKLLAELTKIPVVDYKKEIDDKLVGSKKIQDKLNEHNGYIALKEEILNKFNALTSTALKCPKCDHKFNATGQTLPAKPEIDNLIKQIASLKEERVSLKTEIDELQKSVQPLYAAKEKQDAIQIDIKSHNRKIKNLTDERNRLAKQNKDQGAEYDRIASKTFEEQSAGVLQQLSEKEQGLQQLRLQLEELNLELTAIKKWIDHFYDFKFYLGNKPLENICALVNQYLKINGSDLNLYIEGFKKLRSGELRQALTPVVYRNWMNPQPLDQFSEGERARLNLTVDLAFQQLINSTSKYGGLDYYQSDELLNSLDSVGVSNAANAFNNLNKTIVLVTHSGSDLNYCNEIVIQKKNAISRIHL